MVKCEIEILGPSMGPSGVQVRSAQHRPITFQLRRIVCGAAVMKNRLDMQ